jgi:hypothetical protein
MRDNEGAPPPSDLLRDNLPRGREREITNERTKMMGASEGKRERENADREGLNLPLRFSFLPLPSLSRPSSSPKAELVFTFLPFFFFFFFFPPDLRSLLRQY